MITHVLYNPLAGEGDAAEKVKVLQAIWSGEMRFCDMTQINSWPRFLSGLGEEDRIILAGGDGTLNRFVNVMKGCAVRQRIFFYPIGTGNDFARDMGREAFSEPFEVTQELVSLPTVEVGGQRWLFLNGVGFGVDGYCCLVGDELRKVPGKRVNYTLIAIRGLLGGFQARNARVTVDGRQYEYRRVWIAPAMFGRYYGGGMIPAPEQSRSNSGGTVSVMIFHGAGRLRTLLAFPGIFRGTHVKHGDLVRIHSGHEIRVEFDRPAPLQIDGETIPTATGYIVRSAQNMAQMQTEAV